MDAASKPDRGFTDDDDEDEEYARREGSARRELSAKADGRNNGEQKAISPRSKHSATEQRRRSKINDRFQILRDLIPHTDQKRDKASFLLEVIEYIQFLHEKVQKYEAALPGWNGDNAKLMTWRVPAKSVGDPTQLIQNGPSPGFLVSGDHGITTATAMLNCQESLETVNVNSGVESKENFSGLLHQFNNVGGYVQSQQTVISNSENIASQSNSQWLGSGVMMPGYGQDMAIEDGTINISSPYSHGLLQALGQTLQDCGIDMSLANFSVQINLGKRAFSRPVLHDKDHSEDPSAANDVIGFPEIGSDTEESDQINKKQKTDN